MMLPTASGLLRTFDRVTRARPDRERMRLRLALVAGFLSVWLVVGYLLRSGDIAVHLAVDSFGWLAAHTALIAASALAVAGAFQFSDLKNRCLTACRTPRAFVVGGWRGGRPQRTRCGSGSPTGARASGAAGR